MATEWLVSVNVTADRNDQVAPDISKRNGNYPCGQFAKVFF